MEFNQIMLMSNGEMTEEEKAFRTIHEEIVASAQRVTENYILMAKDLKQMRDTKLYKNAGFEEFADYTEQALNIKVRQAYNYISVMEKLSTEYIEEHKTLGITKLSLLASVAEEEREKIEEHIDVEKATAREVNDEVKKAIAERDEAKKQISLMENEIASAEDEAKEERERADEAEQARLAIQKTYEEQKQKLILANKRESELSIAKAKAEQELKVAKENVKTVIQPDATQMAEIEEHKKHIAELEEKLKQSEIDLSKARATKTAAIEDSVKEFKIRFADLQDTLDKLVELLGVMPGESAVKCKNAVGSVLRSYAEDLGL